MTCIQIIFNLYWFFFASQNSLPAAGWYLCPAPGSKGTKTLDCCSVDGPLPSKTQPFHACTYGEQKHCAPCELEQVIADGKLCSHAQWVNL